MASVSCLAHRSPEEHSSLDRFQHPSLHNLENSSHPSLAKTAHSHSASVAHEASSSPGIHLRSASQGWTQYQQLQRQLQQQPSTQETAHAHDPPFLAQTHNSPATDDDSQMVEVPLNMPQGGVRGFYERNRGLAYVLLAQVFGVLMNVTTRLLEVEGNKGAGMHPFQILFVRMSITTTLSVAYMYYSKTPHFPLGLREVRWLLMLRGIGGFFGVFGMYYSLMYLPLADATVITFIAPIISCWACSLLISEPFTRMEQAGAFISFIGVMLIARPSTFFDRTGANSPPADAISDPQLGTNPDMANVDTRDIISLVVRTVLEQRAAHSYNDVTSAQRFGAVCVALMGVVGQAGAFTAMRWIGKRAHPLLSVTYFCAWCTVVSAAAMAVLPNVRFLLPADSKEWTYLIFLGICGFLMQFLLSAGLQHEKSSRATNMVYTQMLFALFFDKLVFGTNPTLLSLCGSTLILGSAIYVAVQKESMKHKEEQAKLARAEAGTTGADLEMQQRTRNRSLTIEEHERQGLMQSMDADSADKIIESQQREAGGLKPVG